MERTEREASNQALVAFMQARPEMLPTLRNVVDLYATVADNDGTGDYEWAYGYAEGLGDVVRLLAESYQFEPGYRPEWRPVRQP